MSALLTEFTPFPRLPVELRATIWELVPQPERIVGLMGPEDLWQASRYSRPRSFPSNNNPHPDNHSDEEVTPIDWHFRFVGLPRRHAVFPPLHVNREARAVLLPRFFRPQRFVRFCIPDELPGLFNPDELGSGVGECVVRFDVPFIDYENDIFALFELWKPKHYLKPFSGLQRFADLEHDGHDIDSFIDPFLGLDRNRIQRVGMCEMPRNAELSTFALDLARLPALRSVSIIVLGPDRLLDTQHQPVPPEDDRLMRTNFVQGYPEMLAVQMQHYDCEMRSLDCSVVESHNMLSSLRLMHYEETSSMIRPLPRYVAFINGWLWHARAVGRTSNDMWPIPLEEWWEFAAYAIDSDDFSGDHRCPLRFDCCGPDGHTRDEMMKKNDTETDCKIVFVTQWARKLEDLGLFESRRQYLGGPNEVREYV